jgi:hypothetical protein
MKVTITVPDEQYDQFTKEAETASKWKAVTTQEVIEAKLTRFAAIPNSERALVVWGPDRLKLEAVFQTTVETPERLYNMIRNVATLKIGVVERVFSPSEVIRLQDQARFHGWSEEKFLKLTSEEALDYVFNRL